MLIISMFYETSQQNMECICNSVCGMNTCTDYALTKTEPMETPNTEPFKNTSTTTIDLAPKSKEIFVSASSCFGVLEK